MDRWKVYHQLIRKAHRRGVVRGVYCETHHIIPKSLGGSDHPENLVELTYREHFLAHWLLAGMFQGDQRRRMAFAFHAMSMQISGRRILSWQFEIIKRYLVEQRLETRKKRLEFKKKLEREKFGKQKQKAFVLIDRYKSNELTEDDLIDLTRLISKHRFPLKVVNRRHIRDKIAQAFEDAGLLTSKKFKSHAPPPPLR